MESSTELAISDNETVFVKYSSNLETKAIDSEGGIINSEYCSREIFAEVEVYDSIVEAFLFNWDKDEETKVEPDTELFKEIEQKLIDKLQGRDYIKSSTGPWI
jgi:hypothetical protein